MRSAYVESYEPRLDRAGIFGRFFLFARVLYPYADLRRRKRVGRNHIEIQHAATDVFFYLLFNRFAKAHTIILRIFELPLRALYSVAVFFPQFIGVFVDFQKAFFYFVEFFTDGRKVLSARFVTVENLFAEIVKPHFKKSFVIRIEDIRHDVRRFALRVFQRAFKPVDEFFGESSFGEFYEIIVFGDFADRPRNVVIQNVVYDRIAINFSCGKTVAERFGVNVYRVVFRFDFAVP